MNKTNDMFDFVVQNQIATESELKLVTDINGYSIKSINDVIYERTGYHDAEQLFESERDSYDFSMLDTSDWVSDDDEEDEDGSDC